MKKFVMIITITLMLTLAIPTASADIFDDAELGKRIDDLCDVFDFAQVESIVNEYISTRQPEETDNAYKVLELINENRGAVEAIDAQVDDFDNSRTFTLDGVVDLDGHCIVSRYNSSDWFYTILGFIADDWVFFDRIAISVDGKVIYDAEYDTLETVTEVLDDGRVTEYVKTSPDFLYDIEKYDAIRDCEKAMIRFSNSKTDKKYQYTLTKEEKNALVHGKQLIRLRLNISNMWWRYIHPES